LKPCGQVIATIKISTEDDKVKKVLLVGSGGYGAGYLEILLDKENELGWHLEGIVDPYAANGPYFSRAIEKNVPIYEGLEAYYAEHRADIAVIATPIRLHREQSVFCMEHGSDVLLEKPVAGSAEEACKIAEVSKKTGRKLMLGFQWCANAPMLAFKKDADEGRFGKLLSMKALVLWPRNFAYFSRGTRWAGKCYAEDGTPIFDSIASNATAHYLFNELWVAGKEYQASTAEKPLWYASRANDIETFDTVAIKAKTENGADLFFAASHAIKPEEALNPIFEYRFEKAVVYFGGEGREEKRLEAIFKNGEKADYGLSDNNGILQKVCKAAEYFDSSCENVCPIEAAIKHITLLEELWKKGAPVHTPKKENIIRAEDMIWVEKNAELLKECYRRASLPEE